MYFYDEYYKSLAVSVILLLHPLNRDRKRGNRHKVPRRIGVFMFPKNVSRDCLQSRKFQAVQLASHSAGEFPFSSGIFPAHGPRS